MDSAWLLTETTDPKHSTFLSQTPSQLRTRYCTPSTIRCLSTSQGRKLDFHNALFATSQSDGRDNLLAPYEGYWGGKWRTASVGISIVVWNKITEELISDIIYGRFMRAKRF